MNPGAEADVDDRRVPPLAGALNFRDLGGYTAADGRTIRWRQVYRSGTTHALSAADLAWMVQSGIRCAYDFRSNGERRDYPSRLIQIENLRYACHDHEQMPGSIRRALRLAGAWPAQSRRLMCAVYRQLPRDGLPAFRTLFRHLLDGDLPIVFCCAAGKDRTGVAAALVLDALGVDRDQIFEDYLLTDRFYERSCALLLSGPQSALFDGVAPAVWQPLMRAYPEYLDAMYAELEASHGSVLRFLEEAVGLDQDSLERLRSQLLE